MTTQANTVRIGGRTYEDTGRYTKLDAPCVVCKKSTEPQVDLLLADTRGRFAAAHRNCWDLAVAGSLPETPTGFAEQAVSGADLAVVVDEAEAALAAEQVLTAISEYVTGIIPAIVVENVDRLSRVAEIKVGDMPAVEVDTAHAMLVPIVQAVACGVQPMLVGPAGSGKTTLAEQVAAALGRNFYMASRVTSEYKLTGFIDANGNCVRTQFREAYEFGGVFLLDEVDASDADAMTTFNAALANGAMDFPDGMVQRHADFAAIAAGNTFGRGADRQYVGRNQLDAATLDRFCVFEVDYDKELERKLAGDADWVAFVQAVRLSLGECAVRHIVSPRASMQGARLLAAGMAHAAVAEATVWKGLDKGNRDRTIAHMRGVCTTQAQRVLDLTEGN